jgi:molybdenum-dependent DNA-binding transcriptional regulator ModE
MKGCKYSNEDIMQGLIASGSVSAAAKAMGISRQTIFERLKIPEFKEEYEKRRAELLETAVNNLKSAIIEAVETQREIMNNKENAVSSRSSAADSILRHTLRYIEMQEIEARLSALEERIKE